MAEIKRMNINGTTYDIHVGLPYTEVDELPEASDDTKGIIYKAGESFYVCRKKQVGLGQLEEGKRISELTHNDNGRNVLNEITDGYHDLFYADGNRVYYQGSTYEGDGKIYFSGSEGDGYVYNYPDTFNLCNMYARPYDSEGLVITGITELGIQVFGGIANGWVNFITGETS